MALYQWDIDKEVAKLQKCVASWKIIKFETKKNWDCFYTLNLYIDWNVWWYKIVSSLQTWNCTYDTIYQVYSKNPELYNKMPSVWDNISMLVDKTDYRVISDNKNYIESYKGLEVCKPNLIIKENYEIYYYIWWIFILLLIIWIFLFRKEK